MGWDHPSPLLSTVSLQPDNLKLPYPPNREQRSSKTPHFIIASHVPACQGLIGRRANPALRFANCHRRDTSVAHAADERLLAQQFLFLKGVRFYKKVLKKKTKTNKRRNMQTQPQERCFMKLLCAPRFSWCWRESGIAVRNIAKSQVQIVYLRCITGAVVWVPLNRNSNNTLRIETGQKSNHFASMMLWCYDMLRKLRSQTSFLWAPEKSHFWPHLLLWFHKNLPELHHVKPRASWGRDP